jgi:hypothetical protein
MKKDQFKENLLDQARVFYYKCCDKCLVSPETLNKKSSEVDSEFIFLKSSKGDVAKVRYTTTHLFIKMGENEYTEQIKDPISNYEQAIK